MTLRLVALMSVVLLLSLGSFGLLVAHYQDQVMQEVARVASEVGRATLRTLELETAAAAGGVPSQGPHQRVMVWHAAPSEPAGEAGPARERKIESRRVAVAPAQPGVVATEERFVIRVDEVRAEHDPVGGFVLTIPRLEPEGPAVATQAGLVRKREREIRLPIPLQDLETLFASVRARSLGVFLGVFVLGTVLSAGLAARFTRPVRRLDAAIRRLSDGDLEVQVEPRGRDEIARLGRAFNDMTRSLRANRQRARELVRREKHSALGRLAAGVAHDVRNPLHSIGLTLQHLAETARPEDAGRSAEFDRAVEIIRGEIRRLDQLVSNFLRFARAEPHERRPVDLADLLRETERLVRKEAEWRGVELRLELAGDVPPLPADGEALRSSILNLVLNAFDAMPQGGRLDLVLRREGREAVVEVGDTGPGIAAEDQDRVFEFGFTTREGGTGLGLAMVHQCVVEEHGGRVALDSAPGRGARVRLALPVGSAAQEVPS